MAKIVFLLLPIASEAGISERTLQNYMQIKKISISFESGKEDIDIMQKRVLAQSRVLGKYFKHNYYKEILDKQTIK